MTLTLEIPRELLIRAESYALAHGKDVETLLLNLLENSLSELAPPQLNRAERRAYGKERIKILAAERGLEWDAMGEEERDTLLIELLDD